MKKKVEELLKEMKKGSFNVKEFLTRSEGPQLFTDVLNDMLMQGYNNVFPSNVESIYTSMPITQGRTIRFPSVRAYQPDAVPEGTEYQRSQWETTGISVTVDKIGGLLGLTREMIDDNQVGLMGWRAEQAGARHKEQLRQELVKCLSFFSTGPSVSTGIFGFSDHGIRYANQGYTNFLSATALSWETIFAVSRARLWTQRITITAKGIDIPFPVVADFILANPHHEMPIRKVVQASITVVGSGAGANMGGGATADNIAGSNVFRNVLQNLVFDPTIPTGQCIIGASKKGAVLVTKDSLETEEFNNFYFDCNDLKSRERYKPAIIEDRYFIDVQMSG